MQIRKSRLKQIIQEEVANAKFIDISEEAINQEEEAEEEAAEASPPVEFSQNITLDELIVQEITDAMEKDTRHRRQADTAKNLNVPSYVKKNVQYKRNQMADEEDKWGGNKDDQNRSATKGEKSLKGAEDYKPVFEEEELDLDKAIDKDHEGYCTPMTKSTCTPPRKAMAKRLKPGGDLYKDIHGKKA